MSADDTRRCATQLNGTDDPLRWWRSTLKVERRLHNAPCLGGAAAAATVARNTVLSRALDMRANDVDIVR
jgi:hypothetical protein